MTRRVPFGRTALALQAVAAAVFLVLLITGFRPSLPFSDDGRWTIHVALADAGGLSAGARAPVTIGGVTVGRVTGVAEHEGQAVAALELDKSARGVLHADSQATVTPRSALEDLTLDLTPGSSHAAPLAPGATITAANSHGPVTLDEVVDALDTDTRAQVQVLLGQLAVGLRGRSGALRDAVLALRRTVDPAAQVLHGLARRRVLLRRLSGELATTFTALGDHDTALAGALAGGRQVLDVTARRRADLAGVVDRLPGVLGRLDGALRSVRALSAPLTPALERLRPAARALPRALAGTARQVPSLRALVASVGALARDGGPGLRSARTAVRTLGPTAAALTPAARDLTPVIAAVNAQRDGIGLLGERFGGVLSTNDANGTVLRGLGFFEPFNPEDVGEPGASGPRRTQLAAQAVAALTRVCVRDNPVACLVRYLVPGLPGAVR